MDISKIIICISKIITYQNKIIINKQIKKLLLLIINMKMDLII
jgi:hypothetical protein